ncbi:hypothetical protein [Modestobacter sp. SYSU DS0290]
MNSHGARALARTLTLATIGLASLAGCTADGEVAVPSSGTATPGAATPSTGTPSTGTPSTGTPPASPTPAGAELAELTALLPSGRAGGQVTVRWAGLGELTGPFSGTCRQDAGVTVVEGASDTATLTFRFEQDGSTLVLQDQDVRAVGDLAAGDYRVDGGTLTAEADLLGGGGSTGSLSAEITCG